MTKRDQKRFVREYCDTLKTRLLKNVAVFPADWDGNHIRALAAGLQDMKREQPPCVVRAFREMKRSMQWYALPL